MFLTEKWQLSREIILKIALLWFIIIVSAMESKLMSTWIIWMWAVIYIYLENCIIYVRIFRC